MRRSVFRSLAVLMLLSLAACADIDRTLYNVSEAVAPQDRVTGQRTLNLASRQTQIAQSNQQGQQMVQQNYTAKGLPVNEKVDAVAYKRLQTIFARVHRVSHLADESWTVILLPDEQFNAFVMGGTQMFFFKGALDQTKSDDEVAAIIGHEIAHVAANHVYEQQSYTMAARLQGSKSASRSSFQSAFTYKNEEEADAIGVLYATLAGYDPYAASRLWQRMYESKGDFSAMLIDHPINSARSASARALADRYKQYYQAGRVNPDHAAILRQEFGGAQANPENVGQGAGLMAVLGTAMGTLANKEAVKAQEAAQNQNLQFLSYVNQNMSVKAAERTGANSLRAVLGYGGQYPIRNVTVVAGVGQQSATAHNPATVMPGGSVTGEFTFKEALPAKLSAQNLKLMVGHAERAQ